MGRSYVNILLMILPHIVFLFSDTGGGHRSAAQAIIEALELEFPHQTTHEMVDFFRAYAPPLLNRTPDFYPPLSRKPELLGLIFHSSDGAGRTRLFLNILWPYIRSAAVRLLREHPTSLFVSVHPLINAPLGRALERTGSRTPFMTVVTDLVTTHASWFTQRSDLVVVPTQAAFQRGVRYGVAPGRMRVVGLPVAERNQRADVDCREARALLGWPQDGPVMLLVGGGEGMGPLEQMAKAIDAARLPVTLIIVAGRNSKLKERLEQHPWQVPAKVYGFVQDMPDFMRASDILLTKAGPGTISEALAAGLPMILYSRLNGPEEGNVGYVVEHGAGVWAPSPEQVIAAAEQWLDHPQERALAVQACLALARPGAARGIASLIMEQICR
jgi:1,2-diacylglycerol 3-beta-galactosyltransferase